MMHLIFTALFAVVFVHLIKIQNKVDELSEHLDYLEDVVTYKTKGE